MAKSNRAPARTLSAQRPKYPNITSQSSSTSPWWQYSSLSSSSSSVMTLLCSFHSPPQSTENDHRQQLQQQEQMEMARTTASRKKSKTHQKLSAVTRARGENRRNHALTKNSRPHPDRFNERLNCDSCSHQPAASVVRRRRRRLVVGWSSRRMVYWGLIGSGLVSESVQDW